MNTTTEERPAGALQTVAPGHDRSKYLGGSDIAAVVGISPWKTRLQLWSDKITPRVEGKRSRPLTRGIRWESVVAEMLVEELESKGHKVQIVNTNQRYIDSVHPWMAAEIDFEIILDDDDEITNVELKTVHPFKAKSWGESGSDQQPDYYTAQVMHGLGVTQRRKGMLAALFGADELRTYPIPADDAVIGWLRTEAVGFWTNHVLTKTPPAPTTLDDLSRMYPAELTGGQPLLADADLAERVMRMRAINAEIKAREAEYEAIEFQVKRAMQDAGVLVMPNGKDAITWVKKSGKSLDHDLIKERDPKLYREAQKPWEARVFTLKNFSTEGL